MAHPNLRPGRFILGNCCKIRNKTKQKRYRNTILSYFPKNYYVCKMIAVKKCHSLLLFAYFTFHSWLGFLRFIEKVLAGNYVPLPCTLVFLSLHGCIVLGRSTSSRQVSVKTSCNLLTQNSFQLKASSIDFGTQISLQV